MIDEDIVTHATRLHGNAYTEDADYLRMWGQPQEAIIYDWTIRQYRRVTMQSLLTPRDAVTPARPDDMIDEPEFREEVRPYTPSVKIADRHAEIYARVYDYLVRHGPTSARDMGLVFEMARTTLTELLYKRRDIYFKRKQRYAVLWGIRGVHDER